jgi:homocysteine S-methyltransferase
MGDPSQSGKQDSGQIPSRIVKKLREMKLDSKIDLYLSISNKPDFSKIGRKLESKPKGFMTQVVQNIEQVKNLADNLKEFLVIPIILFPSEKNEKSAKFLNLDLTSYSHGFEEFVKRVHDITGDVLITSPSDFNGLNDFLEKFSN